MKKFLSLVLLIATSFAIQAQQLMKLTSLTADTSTSITTIPVIVDNFQVINATTNAATITFYDSSTTNTTYAQAAYTSYASYSTNFSVVFTNQTGVLVTNTFVGTYTAPTAVSGSTVTRPALFIAVVPASSTLSKDVKLQTIQGLIAVATQNATLVTTYRKF